MSDFNPNLFFQALEKKKNYEQLKEIIKAHKDGGFDLEEIYALIEGHFDAKIIPLIKLWANRIWKELS